MNKEMAQVNTQYTPYGTGARVTGSYYDGNDPGRYRGFQSATYVGQR